MTLFPISLLILALLTFVVGVAEGSTVLDYLSIIASAVAFALVLILGRFGKGSAPVPVSLSDSAPRPRREPRTKREPWARRSAPDPFAGYGQARVGDYFGAEDHPDDIAEDQASTSVLGFGRPVGVGSQDLPGTRPVPIEPAIRASSPLAGIFDREKLVEPGDFSGPPTQALAVAGRPWSRPRMVDHELIESSGELSGYAQSVGSSGETPEISKELATDADEPVGLDDVVEFPIADYDDLRIDEIVPLLPELYADEIEVVRSRERAGANRGIILRRLDVLEARLAEAPPVPEPSALKRPAPRSYGPPPAPPVPEPPARTYAPRSAPPPAPPVPEPPARTYAPRSAPPPAPPVPAPAKPSLISPSDRPSGLKIPAVQPRMFDSSSVARGPAFSEAGYTPLPNRAGSIPGPSAADPSGFPIEDYDQLRVIDILAALSELDTGDLEAVRRYEVAGACRAPVLRQIELLSSIAASATATGPQGAAATPAKRRGPRSWSSRD